jgi:uncharacterized SAM-binding protein YcdF (DUF218 family)
MATQFLADACRADRGQTGVTRTKSRMDIELINRCFFPADHLIKADVAIVFGMNDPKRPGERAAELYHQGVARRLLFTGGYNSRVGASEAHHMARNVLASGVPPDAILVEDEAKNTDENVRLSKILLEKKIGLDNVRSVILLTIHYHFRRAYIAMRRHFPPNVMIGWASYPSCHYRSDGWSEAERGQQNILSEIEKIERYYGLTLSDIGRQPL